MKKYILLLIILLSSCSSTYHMHLFTTQSDNVQILENKSQVFYEDENLRIDYDFWYKGGLLLFQITNKSNKPIYIDWKKSASIFNGKKLDYWINEYQTLSSGISVGKSKTATAKAGVEQYYGEHYYGTSTASKDKLSIGVSQGSAITVQSSSTQTIIPERITFIPPESYYTITSSQMKKILTNQTYSLSKFKTLPLGHDSKKTCEIKEQEYNKNNSPIVFRNFLTLSFSEEFENEFYVDHEFFVSNIKSLNTECYPELENKNGSHQFYKIFNYSMSSTATNRPKHTKAEMEQVQNAIQKIINKETLEVCDCIVVLEKTLNYDSYNEAMLYKKCKRLLKGYKVKTEEGLKKWNMEAEKGGCI